MAKKYYYKNQKPKMAWWKKLLIWLGVIVALAAVGVSIWIGVEAHNADTSWIEMFKQIFHIGQAVAPEVPVDPTPEIQTIKMIV